MTVHRIKHDLDNKHVHVTVIDNDGHDLVFVTSITHVNANECDLIVAVPGTHRVVVTDGTTAYVEEITVE